VTIVIGAAGSAGSSAGTPGYCRVRW
jgi:hypothetical protein